MGLAVGILGDKQLKYICRKEKGSDPDPVALTRSCAKSRSTEIQVQFPVLCSKAQSHSIVIYSIYIV